MLTPPIEVYPPNKCKKKFCPHKILTNFQIKSSHYNGGGAETMITLKPFTVNVKVHK